MVVGVGVVVVIALFTVPVTSSFSGTITAAGVGLGGAPPQKLFISPPKGAPVSGSFSTAPGGLALGLAICDSSGDVIYSNNSTSGSFGFTAVSSLYTFETVRPIGVGSVSVSGSYSSPILFF